MVKKRAKEVPWRRLRSKQRQRATQGSVLASRPADPLLPLSFLDLNSAREKLDSAIDGERIDRMREYSVRFKLAIESRRSRSADSAAAASAVRRILAEGDSWFDYPFGLDIIRQLEGLLNLPIANMAHYGDEVRQILSLKQRRGITKRLSRMGPDGKPWDALLFSGGGNDIVGDQMCLWLNTYASGMCASDVLDISRFDAVLDIVEAGYRDLISLRDQVSSDTILFFHQYDFAPPNGKGVYCVGPWLKPSLDYRLVPTDLQAEVVRIMLRRFSARLDTVATSPKVVIVRTQGVLPDMGKEWWANELHPTDKGFRTISKQFVEALTSAFPSMTLTAAGS